MNRKLAPVILFVYNRPEHTRKTIEALSNNDFAIDTDLFIFSDAARSEKQETRVNEVRRIIHQVKGFKTISIEEAEKNRGLAKSVILGVTKIIEKFGKVIVLEDDILTSTAFLSYMNDALDFYEMESSIWSISGYQFPFEMPKDYRKTVYAAYRSSSWGWATWKNRWETIDWEIKDYNSYKYNPMKIAKFCKGGTDLDKMLRYQMQGKIDSWAIRWCYNQSMQNKYTIYPVQSLVNSIGTDGSGTHCDPTSRRFKAKLASEYNYSFEHGLKPEKKVMKKYRRVVNRSVLRKLYSFMEQKKGGN